ARGGRADRAGGRGVRPERRPSRRFRAREGSRSGRCGRAGRARGVPAGRQGHPAGAGARGASRFVIERAAGWGRPPRPFPPLPPLLGVISGAITAWGSASEPHVLAGEPRGLTPSMVLTVVLGSACAALLNAASNVINQIYDLENDRINKPDRPLVTGAVGRRGAWGLSVGLYALAGLPTW